MYSIIVGKTLRWKRGCLVGHRKEDNRWFLEQYCWLLLNLGSYQGVICLNLVCLIEIIWRLDLAIAVFRVWKFNEWYLYKKFNHRRNLLGKHCDRAVDVHLAICDHLNICLWTRLKAMSNSFVKCRIKIYSSILSAYVWDVARISIQMVL